MTNTRLFIIGLLIAAIAYGTGRYASPVKTVEVEKIVEKEKKETSRTTRTIKRPDGTVVQEEIVKDKTSKEQKKDTTKIVDNKKPDWFIGVGYGVYKTAYSIEANRRILGPVFIGIQPIYSPDSKLTILVKAGYEF